MRKFWKIENNVNVRKSETLKSRKEVVYQSVKRDHIKIGRLMSTLRSHHGRSWCLAMFQKHGFDEIYKLTNPEARQFRELLEHEIEKIKPR